MDDINLLRKLERVVAPPDFERRVMAGLAERRATAAQARRSQMFRLALTTASASLLVVFLAFNIFVFRPGRLADAGSAAAKDLSARASAMPVIETVDFGREIRSAAAGPRAVYILENVSNVSRVPIKY